MAADWTAKGVKIGNLKMTAPKLNPQTGEESDGMSCEIRISCTLETADAAELVTLIAESKHTVNLKLEAVQPRLAGLSKAQRAAGGK